MRPGVRLAVDVGTVRVGVASSDPAGLLATPVATVPREGALGRIVALAREHAAIEVLVGLPRHLSGAEGASARDARRFATHLSQRLSRGSAGEWASAGASAGEWASAGASAGQSPGPRGGVTVRLVDERLTTVTAERDLLAAGVSGRRARERRRDVVDQAAAVVLLQSALDSERATGQPPGMPVETAVRPKGSR